MAGKIEPLSVRKLADKSEGERIPMLVIGANAGIEREDGSRVIPAEALPRILVNPDTEGHDHEPWPLAGIEVGVSRGGEFVAEPPKRTRVSTSWVRHGVSEGWLELEDTSVVHKPGGPQEEPWRVTHTFEHAAALVIHATDGDVRYRVTRQPDKYDGGPENGTGEPTEIHAHPETSVDHFYDLELA